MAYNVALAEKIRSALKGKRGITEKKMFGGLCFLHNGNMCCGVTTDKLMVRVGPDQYDKALAMKHAVEMDFTGKPLKGMIYVLPEGIKRTDLVKKWVAMGLTFTKTLPKK